MEQDIALLKSTVASLLQFKEAAEKEQKELRQRVESLEKALEELKPENSVDQPVLRDLKEAAVPNYGVLIHNKHHSKNILFVLAFNSVRSLNLSKSSVDYLAKNIGTHVRGWKDTHKRKGPLPDGIQEAKYPTFIFGEQSVDTSIFEKQIYDRNAKTQQNPRSSANGRGKDKRQIDLTGSSPPRGHQDGRTPNSDLSGPSSSSSHQRDPIFLDLSLLEDGKWLSADLIHEFFGLITKVLPVDFVTSFAVTSHENGMFPDVSPTFHLRQLERRDIVFGLIHNHNHYQLFVVDKINQACFLYDSLKTEPAPIPQHIFKLLPKENQYSALPGVDWNPQENSVDCGVHVCLFILSYLCRSKFWNEKSSSVYRSRLRSALEKKKINLLDFDLVDLGDRGFPAKPAAEKLHETGSGSSSPPPAKAAAPSPASHLPAADKPHETTTAASSTASLPAAEGKPGPPSLRSRKATGTTTSTQSRGKEKQRAQEEETEDGKPESKRPRLGELSPTKAFRGGSGKHATEEEEDRSWVRFAEKQSAFNMNTKKGKTEALTFLTMFSWVAHAAEAKEFLFERIYPKEENGEESKHLSAVASLPKANLEVLAKILSIRMAPNKAGKDTAEDYKTAILREISQR